MKLHQSLVLMTTDIMFCKQTLFCSELLEMARCETYPDALDGPLSKYIKPMHF